MNCIGRSLVKPLPKQCLTAHPLHMFLQSSSPYSAIASKKHPFRTPRTQSSGSSPSEVFGEKKVPAPAPAPEIENHKLEHAFRWPRPTDIPWQRKVANAVNLIGYVQLPVQFEVSSDGKAWAGTIITQRDSHSSPSLWIPIIFEGDLAHIAACHLKENDCLYVTGQLSADPPTFILNEGQATVQVMVQSMNFVQRSSEVKKNSAPHKKEDEALKNSGSKSDDSSVNTSWEDLIAKPHEWWHLRVEKGDSAGAIFEHKDSGNLFRVDGSAPEWVRQKLDSMIFDHKLEPKSEENGAIRKHRNSALSSWKDLISHPNDWRDYRKGKLSGSVKPKHPDFKRKDNGSSLWLDSAPKSLLPDLELLEIDGQIHGTGQVKGREGDENSWKDLVENPNRWWDNRSDKMKARSPDFKHKETGKALWLSDSPAWVLPRLPPVKPKGNSAAAGQRETLLS